MFEDNPTQQPPQEPQAQPEPQAQQQEPAQPAAPEAPKQPAQPAKPAEKPIQTTQDEKMWAAIGYIAFLGLVTMAMKPKSEFCRQHASQGLVLFAVWFVGLILLAIGSVFSIVGGILMIAVTVLAILGILKAFSSYELKVPVLSDIAKKVPVNSIIGSMTGKKATPVDPAKPTEPAATPEAQPTQEQPAEPATEEPAPEPEVETEKAAETAPATEPTTEPEQPAEQGEQSEASEAKPEEEQPPQQ